jgi:elongation factor G
VGAAETFTGLIDLVRLERLDFDPASQGANVTRRPLSGEEQALAAPWRESMRETLAESDEVFLDAYLAGSFDLSDIQAAIRRATLARRLTPVLAGSALRNTGVQPVLDAVCDYLPSPLDVEPPLALDPETGESRPVPCDPKAPFLALVFKVIMDGGRKLAFLRLYAGALREGDACRAAGRAAGRPDGHKENERVARLYRLHADRREQLDAAFAGDIVAVVGLRHATTGDTVGAPGQAWVLERIGTYAPVISRALEPRNADEGKALDEALARFTTEDPTLTVELDEGSGHRILSGMGELHLDVVIDRMRREYGVAPRAGNPQVIRRETVARPGAADGLFERELGDVLHHGDLGLAVAPRARGAGNAIVFAPEAEAAPLPRALREAILRGVEDALLCGPATGYPVQDVEVRVTAVRRKEGVSTAPGFQMAANLAVRQALEAARPLPLEPIMAVEISVPEGWLGPAIGLFGAHGGKVEALEERGGQKCVQGLAPLARLFGFSTELRSATQGRAGLVLRFARFDA